MCLPEKGERSVRITSAQGQADEINYIRYD